MKTLKFKVLAALLALPLMASVVQAQYVTNTIYTAVGSAISDGNPTGITSSTNLSGIAGIVSSIQVNLDITGGFNGDLYVYLAGPASGLAVLLNRTGVTTGNSFGYTNAGFNITFDDTFSNIHLYQNFSPVYSGGQLTESWAPDGRQIDPQSSGALFDSTSPTAQLSVFDNNTANGTWTLFAADMSSGGQSTLVSWGLTIVTVPEPQTWALAAGGVAVLLAINRRRKL